MDASVKRFYMRLGTEGMSALMSKERNAAYVQFIEKRIPKNRKLLDLACGYGRLTIPLAKRGYSVEGIDLAANLIQAARKLAKEQRARIEFKVGNMVRLPYGANSFDAVMCMWSSFNHLLNQKTQIKALNEIEGILRKDGIAIIDMPYHRPQEKHIRRDIIGGIPNVEFIHNKASITKVLNKSNVKEYKVKLEQIGGRKRLVVYIKKL